MAKTGSTPEQDPAGAIAGLAGELDALGQRVGRLSDVPDQVSELATLVAGLADQLATHAPAARPHGPASWLALPPERQPSVMLHDLAEWMARVFLRYPDAAQQLPDCWLWHPDVVEELLWLRLAWALVQHPELGTPLMVGDWHDRYRPGVVRRIRDRAGTCSLERHREAAGAPVVPLRSAVDEIAAWWGSERTAPPPAPSEAHLAEADRLRRIRGGRR